MGNNIITLTKHEIEAWGQAYGLRDAKYGGLVLGNRHSEGGVKMANEISPEVYSIAVRSQIYPLLVFMHLGIAGLRLQRMI